jgi:hypothetical protein
VHLSSERIKALCRSKRVRLGSLLAGAHVSRTAYYSLVRKETVLPKSVHALASTLGVAPKEILEEESPAARRALDLMEEVERISKKHPHASRDDIRLTLLLLDEKPIDRLRRGLLRARKSDLHQA